LKANFVRGCVVSEYFNNKATRDSYLNLHFPASDIPKQARELYVVNKIRVLYDRDEETARLMCRTLKDAETPLDLKHSYLRAMSPIHIKYLHNLGVRASMSISLMVENKLWGLVSCHNYGSEARVSLPVRELCRSLGETCSTHIEKLLYSARIKVRKPLSAAPKKTSPTAFIAASSSDLLKMFDADFGFLAIKGEARTVGKLSAYNEAIALLQYIRQRAFTEIFATQNIKKDCPGVDFEAGFSVLAGMLVVPLALDGVDFLVFFRKAKSKEIIWAGNPHEKSVRPGTNAYLEPRSSFKRWSEQVVGMSREWTEDQGRLLFPLF
jgi:light-regulated signal transduction histidine kinase (bacteriophytochrome)